MACSTPTTHNRTNNTDMSQQSNISRKINPENYIQHGALINHCYLGDDVDNIKRKQKNKIEK